MTEVAERPSIVAVGEGVAAAQLCHESGEAYHLGDLQRARTLALRAVDAEPQEPLALSHACWLFSVLAEDATALEFYTRLAKIGELTAAQHMNASVVALRVGEPEVAAAHALDALALEPDSVVYVKHGAAVLNSVGRPKDAAVMLANAARADSKNAYWFRELSSSCSLMGRDEQAVTFSQVAWTLEPRNVEYGVNLAGLKIQRGEFDDANRVLSLLVDSGLANGSVYLLLSSIACRQSEFIEALVYDERGLALEPGNFDLLMNKGAVCCMLSRFEEAADAFLAALRAAPDNMQARRGAFVALTQAKRVAEATSVGSALIHDLPEDDEIARTFQGLLTIRFAVGAAETPFDGTTLVAAKARYLRENPVPQRQPAGALAIQGRLIGALFLREMHTRFGNSSLGYLWALFEPLAHIGVMVTLINVLSHGSPPIGDSFAVFYFTGIIPYHMFTHTSSQLASAIAANRPMLQLPLVKTTDVLVSRALLELVTELAVAAIFFCAFVMMGYDAIPRDIIYVLGGLLLVWGCAFGIGMINAVISTFFNNWEKIWGAVTSALYFSSGTFYIPRMMPEFVRNVLAWNPVLQAIEMVRAGYFHETIPPWLSVSYLATLSLSLLAIGFCLEYLFRARLVAVE